MVRKVFYACIAALILASTADAGVILGLLKDPANTAGVATSNRSGPGTWQLYAIEDSGQRHWYPKLQRNDDRRHGDQPSFAERYERRR